MYCGDETGSFIGEISSSSSRFGYGGEGCPKAVQSSYMHRDGTIPASTHHYPKEDDIVPIFKPNPRDKNGTSSVDPDSYLDQGIIENYDAWENAWHKAFQQLHVHTLDKHTKGGTRIPTPRIHSSGISSSTIQKNKDTESVIMHPILAIDHGYTHLASPSEAASTGTGEQYRQSILQKQKSNMIEILYESLSAPAIFIAPAPMLASFANGRQTSLVVDIGAGGTRVTPVVDGLILEQAQRRNGRGGDWLGAVQERVVRDMKKKEIRPRYACGTGREKLEDKRESIFHQFAMRDCMYEMKTSPHMSGVAFYRNDEWTIPFMNGDRGESDSENNGSGTGTGTSSMMDVDNDHGNDSEDNKDDSDDDENYDLKCKKYYTLPDGTRVNLRATKPGRDLCRLPELLFASELPFSSGVDQSPLSNPNQATLSNLPLHELIKDSLSVVSDADVRKELCGNIILTGAASLVTNIESRLSLEVQHLVPSMYKCKVIASRNTLERRYASWIGGSVLSSLGSFQQLWLSKREYEEYGMTLAAQRFP